MTALLLADEWRGPVVIGLALLVLFAWLAVEFISDGRAHREHKRPTSPYDWAEDE